MDLPMFYQGNAFVIAAGQVYFLHMILMDSDSGAAMCLGRTYLTSVRHAEPLNAANLDLTVK
jgi:Xaa-Pro dipeptidase